VKREKIECSSNSPDPPKEEREEGKSEEVEGREEMKECT